MEKRRDGSLKGCVLETSRALLHYGRSIDVQAAE